MGTGMIDSIDLHLGTVACRVAPQLGGALLSLQIDGSDILRPTTPTPENILDTACFPLVPFANRIANGRFCFGGRAIDLPADAAAPPHAHHGHGWRTPWTLVSYSAGTAAMTFLYRANAWPWTYRATQRLTLLPDGLGIEMAVENLSALPMPCGFGLHPYFVRDASSYIEIEAPERLLPDGRGIPCIPSRGLSGRHDLATLPASDDLLLAGSGRVTIGTAAWEVELIAAASVGWQFYLPAGQNFYCLEPVSHRPDSFNRDAELDAIAPGASLRWAFALQRRR